MKDYRTGRSYRPCRVPPDIDQVSAFFGEVLERPVLRLHPRERPADPLHIPVRLVRPGSRVVFSPVILVTLLMDDRLGKRKRLTVRTVYRNSGGKTLALPRPAAEYCRRSRSYYTSPEDLPASSLTR